jgi:hypothetical protein
VSPCVCVCVPRVCVRACVRECARARVSACMRARQFMGVAFKFPGFRVMRRYTSRDPPASNDLSRVCEAILHSDAVLISLIDSPCTQRMDQRRTYSPRPAPSDVGRRRTLEAGDSDGIDSEGEGIFDPLISL